MLRHLCRVGLRASNFNHAIKNSRHVMVQWRSFNSEMTAGWPDAIKNFLAKENIDQPTLIQEKTLPLAMANKDLVGIARTGSGKTLAFVIPAVMKIINEREQKVRTDLVDEEDGDEYVFKKSSPTCLVLAPTRELANQTAEVFRKFKLMGIKSIVLVGGASRSEQIRSLGAGGHEVYIATPGRLMDLVSSDIVDLSKIKYLVLDEADRMLDMGFEPQIREIIGKLPRKRQTLMWSATWPQEIQSLAQEFMRDYEHVQIDSGQLKANPNIKQVVEVCEGSRKFAKMLNHLKRFGEECEQPRTLIFVNTKHLADSLLLQLMRNRYRAISMHGDRSQYQRDNALRLFKSKSCNIMVATDVAARGLDISDITHVINYDFPPTIEDYIHRIGRTARHDKKGTSVSLLTTDDAQLAGKLIQVLKETSQPVPPELESLHANRNSYKSISSKPRGSMRKRFNSFAFN